MQSASTAVETSWYRIEVFSCCFYTRHKANPLQINMSPRPSLQLAVKSNTFMDFIILITTKQSFGGEHACTAWMLHILPAVELDAPSMLGISVDPMVKMLNTSSGNAVGFC